jgi:prepilin-type N-terminal cleavage/methylation domain-containing protein
MKWITQNFLGRITRRQSEAGFTLVELMVVVAIVAIIAAFAVPSFNDFAAKNRVKGAAEDIYGLILQAKSETPIRDTNLSVNVNTGANPWCVGFSTTVNCDCTNTTDCTVPVGAGATQVLQVVNGTNYDGVTIAETFAGTGTTFRLPRNSASQAGTISVVSGNWQLNIVISTQGRIRVCNPNNNAMTGYDAC